MNEREQALADRIYSAIQDESNYSQRTLQSKDFKVGISDLGFCSERTRRMLDQQVPADKDLLEAWIGTALGDYMERAEKKIWPDAITQAEITVTLVGSRGTTYTLPGHPDLILPEGLVLDNKTVFGLTYVERDGADQQKQMQRHLYALGAHQAGLFRDGLALEEVQVGNVWMDRGGKDKRLHVQVEPFDWTWVHQAAEWVDDVVYAWVHEEEARKEPPRQMCAKACGFYDVCRARDTDVEGLLPQEKWTAVEMYVEGRELENRGKRLKEEGKAVIEGLSGSTGKHMVRQVWINSSNRNGGYWKIDVAELPKRRVT